MPLFFQYDNLQAASQYTPNRPWQSPDPLKPWPWALMQESCNFKINKYYIVVTSTKTFYTLSTIFSVLSLCSRKEKLW